MEMDGEMMEVDDVSPWNFIPDLVLRKVYSYLSYEDRMQMSLTCKAWSGAFSAACNWRQLQFPFPGVYSSDQHHPALKFGARFGHVVRHAEVIYSRINDEQEHIALRRFQSICAILKEKSQLTSISIDNLQLFFLWSDHSLKLEVMNSIVSVLKSQNRLKSLNFQFCGFSKKDFAKLFNAISQKTSLIHINLEDREYHYVFEENNNAVIEDEGMNEDDNDYEERKSVHWFCGCLHSLKILESDYSPFLEVLVSNLATHLRDHPTTGRNVVTGALKDMYIDWSCWYRELRGITDEAWKLFRQIFPDLRLHLDINTAGGGIDPKSIMELIIKRNMPVHSLCFTIDDFYNVGFEKLSPAELFDHIVQCRLNSEIEVLQIINFESKTFFEEIDAFVRRSNLKCFEIQISYPVDNLKNLLKSWLQNPPKGLQQFTVMITSLPGYATIEHYELSDLEDFYAPKFQNKGILFRLPLEFQHFSNIGCCLTSYHLCTVL